MAREIIKEQLSPEAKDSMGNPVGQSHKPIQVRDGGSLTRNTLMKFHTRTQFPV